MWTRPSLAGACLFAALVLGLGSVGAQESREVETPRAIGHVERSESRLAQLDITVLGPPETVRSLTAEEFRIKINLRLLDEFELDRLCGAEALEETASSSPQPGATRDDRPAPRAAGSYLFYFDQPHLTLAGRQRALDLAGELIDEVLTGGAQALIVSNGTRLALIEPLTSDRQRLLEALERLEHDRSQWDFYAERERFRVQEVVQRLNEAQDVQRAIGIARLYQKEERWRTEQSLRRLELALSELMDLDPPKAVVYFADTMRSNAGEHYLGFFGSALRDTQATLGVMGADTLTGRLAFDRVVNVAAAQGIRFYTVQAEGLVSHFDDALLNPKAMNETSVVPSSSRVRVADAQRALNDLAGETGGHAFLNGIRGSKIADRILADSSCVYLASFDPSRFPTDSPLRVSVKVSRPDVETRVRGRLVVQSESARLASRLLRAFGSAGSLADPFEVGVGLVPIGFEGGTFLALLQIRVPATALQGATWDLGASIVSASKVRDETSGRIRVSGPGVPVILEHELKFKPGAYEIVSVAHEAQTGLIASREIDLEWPAPGDGRATLTPVALLQPAAGAFLRSDETRTRGSLTLGSLDPVRVDRPTALIALVCHGRGQNGALTVERGMTGKSESSFDTLVFDLEKDRCAQIRDVMPPGSLEPGFHRYELRVLEDDRVLAERVREFLAVAPGTG